MSTNQTQPTSAPIQMPQPQAGEPVAEKTKSSIVPIVLIGLLFVLIITGGYFVLNTKTQPTYQAQTQTPATTQLAPSVTPPIPTPQTPQEAVQQVNIDNPATDVQSVTSDVNQL